MNNKQDGHNDKKQFTIIVNGRPKVVTSERFVIHRRCESGIPNSTVGDQYRVYRHVPEG